MEGLMLPSLRAQMHFVLDGRQLFGKILMLGGLKARGKGWQMRWSETITNSMNKIRTAHRDREQSLTLGSWGHKGLDMS